MPVPKDINGNPAIHYTTISKVFARWADDGSLWQAFMASVAHLAVEKQLDRVLPVTALDMAHVIRYTRLPQRIQTCCFCD